MVKGMRVDDLFKFIQARHSIYLQRQAGKPKPWTKDKILQRYRFCNVYRELDKETVWLANNWRRTHGEDQDFWFAALVFRLTNWHETAEELGVPLPWNPRKFKKVLAARKERGVKVYGGAYTISTNGVKQVKHEYLAEQLSAIWEFREQYRFNIEEEDSLQAFYERLMEANCVGSFIAGQVIADAKYCGDMRRAQDWATFASPGPGSKRGLNRVVKRDVDATWLDSTWYEYLSELHLKINSKIAALNIPTFPKLHAQDLQNCLCEFDKYERVRLGEGRPKSTYPGV